jgi:hypothetical protein
MVSINKEKKAKIMNNKKVAFGLYLHLLLDISRREFFFLTQQTAKQYRRQSIFNFFFFNFKVK